MNPKYTSLVFFFLFLFSPAISAHEKGKPHTHEKKKEKKEEKEIKVKIKPFYTANRLLFVSDIKINPSNGFGDFTMKNNANRGITLIFGRVYRYEEKNGRKENVMLINNYNKPAMILSNTLHKSGKEAVWRFSLFQSRLLDDPLYRYTIDINSRSIFFE